MERIILHIDVNSAFLSWSALKLLSEGYPKDIRNEVAVIAGDPSKRHGVIIAASIPAKKKGIKPPTNLYEARRIYQDIIVIKPDMEYYRETSRNLITYLKSLFPTIEQFSVDECFVDYSEMKRIYGDELQYAYKLKDEIKKRFGFTVNIGIGNNKLCAKMASDFEKPDKVHTLYQSEFREKMWPKDVSELFMVGKASYSKLKSIGINTIEDLANYDINVLQIKLKSFGKLLHEYANGIDNEELNTNAYDERKSIGFSRTLATSSDDLKEIYSYLKEFASKISKGLQNKGFYANTVMVTIRNDTFKTISHQEKFLNSFCETDEIYEHGKKVFNELWDGEKIRLLGLSVTDFSESNNYQLSFFDKNIEKKDDIDKIIDKVNKEFGKEVVYKGNKL